MARMCDVCGEDSGPPQPADVVVLRSLLGPQARGYAHPSCLSDRRVGAS